MRIMRIAWSHMVSDFMTSFYPKPNILLLLLLLNAFELCWGLEDDSLVTTISIVTKLVRGLIINNGRLATETGRHPRWLPVESYLVH